jgi:Na+-driven multidrug efflux pump
LALPPAALRRSFLSISLPALVQLTAEPLASLVDSAYLGRLGPAVLGGAGVAISAHYALAKLYNDPLLRTSISLVAQEDAAQEDAAQEDAPSSPASSSTSASISTALSLAFLVGAFQAVFYLLLLSPILTSMGVPPASPMRPAASSYLFYRALGSPAATLWLVTNGVFRGLGDTRTPLLYSLLFTALNALLDPLLIFPGGMGAGGAALGTALAQ